MLSQSRMFSTLIALLTAISSSVYGQDKAAGGQSEFKPQVGQAGKDVIWVPTPQALVDRMLGLGKLTSKDYLIDLGSGDGRTVITAAKRGAKALGIEYNPDMVELSKRNAGKEGVSARAEFRKADLFETDLSEATIITMFLLPDINLRLRPKLLALKPGTRVVSNSFTMAEWKWDDSATATKEQGCDHYCTAYLWIVPAKVTGTWKTPQGMLRLEQEFQVVTGSMTVGGQMLKVSGKMTGDEINFTAGGTQYHGRVNGVRIDGTMKTGTGAQAWIATRESQS